jgi:hypothetical protein
VELEKRAIPVATICTDEFFDLGKEEAKILGMPGLPIATIPHPMAGQAPEYVAKVAAFVLNEIIHIITANADSLENEYKKKTIQAKKKLQTKCKTLLIDEFSIPESDETFRAPDSLEAINHVFYRQGWTDGLPIIPPTSERFKKFFKSNDFNPNNLVGCIPPMEGEATVAKIAINAIMAGCIPKHLPIIIAATKAMTQKKFNLYALQTTTHPCTVLLLINGPLIHELDLNFKYNAMGQGNMGNATIGRAIRLLLINIGGASPGVFDLATQGGPSKYSFCFAENEEENPWEPLHVEKGFPKSVSTVTVIGAEGPHNVNDHGGVSGEEILLTISGVLATSGTNNLYLGGEPLIVLGPEHAAIISKDGFSKKDLKRFLFERARIPVKNISKGNLERFKKNNPKRFMALNFDDSVPIVDKPDDIMVVVTGGKGRHSAVVPTFGGHTIAVTVPITDKSGRPIIHIKSG